MIVRTCEKCGKEFKTYNYRAAKSRYCSYECYWGEKVKTNCATCGKEIFIPPSRIAEGRGKYCSRECSTQRHKHNVTVKRHVGGITNGKRRFDYQIIAENALGRPLKKGEVVHHLDLNPRNSEPSNLVICTQSFHRYLHRRKEPCL